MSNPIFPFTAIVGQEEIKKSLILNAINPKIGGVLIKGDKGTAKTTAVRALTEILPPVNVFDNCPFNNMPSLSENSEYYCNINKYPECENCQKTIIQKKMTVIDLPLGATEDKIVGSINITKALNEGLISLEPGILSKANGNILYVDEINLLDDNLVDVLLDASAYGQNTIERESVSRTHPSNFILVGTMNPAEGELRPQLADRIGLHITVSSITDIEDRIKIMERREEFENNPQKFKEKYKLQQKELYKKIINAKTLLTKVTISKDLIRIIAWICLNSNVDGHRSDIAVLKTSKAVAAFNNHKNVTENDLKEALLLVLGERNPSIKNNISQMMKNAKNKINRRSNNKSKSCPNKNETFGNQKNNSNTNKKKDYNSKRLSQSQDTSKYGNINQNIGENSSKSSDDIKLNKNMAQKEIESEDVGIDIKNL